MTAAQPDEAAELVEKCARLIYEFPWISGQSDTLILWPHVAADDRVPYLRHARVILSVLGPAIREQHGEQIARAIEIRKPGYWLAAAHIARGKVND